MMGIGVVTMISQLTGRYGLAGALSATMALAAAALGPQVSRTGRPVRPAAGAASGTLFALAAAAGLLLAARLAWPDWVLFVCAAGIGCVPSIGAMIRARWAALYGARPQLHTAYSLESVVDEVCFIFGPIISIGLSTVWFPEAGPLLAACFLAAGVFWLTAQRATEPVPASARAAHRRLRAAFGRTPGPRRDVRGDRSDLRGGRRGHRGLRRGAGAQGRRERGPRGLRGRAPAWREPSSGCCTSRGRRNAGGCWASARWP